MKNKFACSFMLLFFICLFILPCRAEAGTQETDIPKTRLGSTDTFYSFDSNTGELVISGTGDTPNYSSNGVGTPWYEWRDRSIKSVVVEEGVTSLGNNFLFQVSADSITLPHSLLKIGNYALSNTMNITQWKLPFGLRTIGAYAFAGNSSITHLTIPDSVTAVNSRAFQGCSSLTEIVIPYSVKSIGTYTFYQCSKLEKVEFQSMTSDITVGSYCFLSCPNLKTIAFPLNAEVNKCSFGYASTSKKYDGISMPVYYNSSAYSYAVANSISYSIIESFPMQCGISYNNEFTEDNINDIYCYEFTAESDESYNFYSLGACDVYAELKDSNGGIVSKSDDISGADRNFMITAELKKGERYFLNVGSVKATGDSTVIVYPDNIRDADVFGSLSLNANQGDYTGDTVLFNITDEMLKNFIITVNFTDGYSDEIYYYSGIFNNRSIGYDNRQPENPFTCGENTADIRIGGAYGEFPVNIEHSYNSVKVPYTADDDGYTLNTCILCADSYKDEFVKTPAITVSGMAYIKESRNGGSPHQTPYTHFVITVDGREYPVADDGSWSFNTLCDCTAVFKNEHGEDVEINVDFDSGSYDYGAVEMQGYDFNGDGHVNAKDYVIYVKPMNSVYGSEYLNYFGRNMC